MGSRSLPRLNASTLCGLVGPSSPRLAPSSRCGSPRVSTTSQARQLCTGSASEGIITRAFLLSQSHVAWKPDLASKVHDHFVASVSVALQTFDSEGVRRK